MGKTKREGPDLLEGTTFTTGDRRPPGGILYELSRFFAEEREHARGRQHDPNDAVTPALYTIVRRAHAVLSETPCTGVVSLTDLPERAQLAARALGVAHEALEAIRASDAVKAAGAVLVLAEELRELRFGPLIEHGTKFGDPEASARGPARRKEKKIRAGCGILEKLWVSGLRGSRLMDRLAEEWWVSDGKKVLLRSVELRVETHRDAFLLWIEEKNKAETEGIKVAEAPASKRRGTYAARRQE